MFPPNYLPYPAVVEETPGEKKINVQTPVEKLSHTLLYQKVVCSFYTQVFRGGIGKVIYDPANKAKKPTGCRICFQASWIHLEIWDLGWLVSGKEMCTK